MERALGINRMLRGREEGREREKESESELFLVLGLWFVLNHGARAQTWVGDL